MASTPLLLWVGGGSAGNLDVPALLTTQLGRLRTRVSSALGSMTVVGESGDADEAASSEAESLSASVCTSGLVDSGDVASEDSWVGVAEISTSSKGSVLGKSALDLSLIHI
mgnify:FL=1